ncbi:beta-ketoacyl synthase N-terminal-like domain-containing protein [Actinomadura geliboluensis]|uniref:beta-ketoacyl synthase N-terminal-like domain-containing protein n=1 Tax=Actinomadura geliboluensis TaxID=882440 RepID=UPI0037162B79
MTSDTGEYGAARGERAPVEIIGVAPSSRPAPHLAVAVARAGGTGVLALGHDRAPALAALADVRRWWTGPFGVRVPAGCGVRPADVPAEAGTVVTGAAALRSDDWLDIAGFARGRRLLIEVADPAEAAEAVRVGRGLTDQVGVIARDAGHAAGPSLFILLQRLLADSDAGVPVFAGGGLGPHAAAAAVAGGAAGIVLDEQFALVREMDLTGPAPAGVARPAVELAGRHKTAGGVVQAVRAEIVRHIRAAVRAEPLAPRPEPVAVQGPMAQVSDGSAFAGAVAQDGGLPFLALGPLDGARARALLRETADRLGGRPWGAGVLEGAPPELRAEQLAAIGDARPPYAIIGGGSPAEAAALEAAGTAAYLPVPSPEPLGRLLGEGVRRFVFAGSECGGQTGPLASLELWDAQVARLLAFARDGGDAAELSVMFAGGVHDARSAAMAAALAGPLAERGADVRVLMGTAYLFTPEAVAAGAILPGYHDVALACTETVLLETAPGQTARCARTPYIETFEQTRRELEQAGTPPQEVRRRLEKLNLGRLHLASRGLRLDTPVGADRQREEGLYAMGQAAALRFAPVGIAALHEQVTTGATDLLAARAADLGIGPRDTARAAPRPADIAVIGIGCVFPGAPDADRYWANVVAGAAQAGDGTPSKWGGLVPDIPFDADAHGIAPGEIGGIDPMHLLSVEVAARALRDAGYADRPFDRPRTSVFFAAEGGGDLAAGYALRATLPSYLGELPPGLDEQLPRPAGETLDGVRTGAVAGWIAGRLGLGGTACAIGATSLAALDAACKDLAAGSSAMVLCGGADLRDGVLDRLLPASGDDGDGVVLGEGVACVVLKRLADAERDGDRIYAVVKSVAGAGGRRRAMDRAYERAGVARSSVGQVALGSVSAQIGHTRCAAGLAGLIKTAYALHTGVLPGDGGARPWAVRPGERFAGVSGSGFGGAHFHAVLAGYEGAPEPVSGLAEWPAELFLIRGDDDAAARAAADRLARLAEGAPRMRDLARTAASLDGPVRAAFVATGPDDLRAKLALAAELRPAPGIRVAAGDPGQVAFLFPDADDTDAPAAAADLFVAFPRLQRLLRLAGGDTGAAVAGLAVHRLLTAVGVHPDLAAGQGRGELAALCAAGAIDDTDMVEIGADPSRGGLLGRDLRSPAFPVWAAATGRPYETEPSELAAVPSPPVPAAARIEAMYDAGARTFVATGRALADLVGTTLGDRPHTAVSCAVPGENGLVTLLRALAELAAAGVPVDPLPLFAGRGARLLTGVPAAPGWIVGGHSVRTADGDHPAGALRPPRRVSGLARDDSAVLEYLRTSREILAAQRDVVLRHLTAPVPASRPAPADDTPARPRTSAHVRTAALSGSPTTPPRPRPNTALPDAPAPSPAPVTSSAPPIRPDVSPPVPGDSPASGPPSAPSVQLDASPPVPGVLDRPEAALPDAAASSPASGTWSAPTPRADASPPVTGVSAWPEAAPPDEVVSSPASVSPSAPSPRADVAPGPGVSAWPDVSPLDAAASSPAAGAADAGVPRMRRVDTQVWPRPGGRVARQVVRSVPRVVDLDPLPVPPDSGTVFAGRRFLLVDDGCGIALELGDLLERHGAEVRTPTDVDGPCDGLVHLAALRPGAASVLPGGFAGIQRALDGGLRWLVLASGAGGTFGHRFRGGGVGDPAPGAGLRGLARTVAEEHPEALVRAVDMDTKETPRAIAQRVMAELLAAEVPVVVGHENGLRHGLELLPAEPLGEGPALSLGRDGVVLLTGAEHEVTVCVARELARTSGCHIELAGGAAEENLRLGDLRELAASVRYHAVDDPQALGRVVEDVYLAHRRLDGVVHGAALPGAADSPERAYQVKVDGAVALVQAVRPDLGFLAVLCGLAGLTGERGRAGDAAADDACGTLAHVWRARLRGRVLAASLGPWAVDGAEPCGVPLDPDAGAAALLREIAHGGETHVVLTGDDR